MTSRRIAELAALLLLAVALLFALPMKAQPRAVDPSTGRPLVARKMITFIVTVPYDLKAGKPIVVKVPHDPDGVEGDAADAVDRLRALVAATHATVWNKREWANCKPCAALPLQKEGR